ncbi:type I restriction enzyme endonuclease domain-containing protein [Streptomyces sp. NPDC096132]|uniref:type I restriction enzyme endonuclease domain-containing protein n=1 Tax=Streptomyces sp. NPDC096132 TaxID=3366075 RepID=UPI003804AD4E
MREVTRHNIVRRTTFSERLQDLMVRYMRRQCASTELIAKLVEMAGHGWRPPWREGQPAAGLARTRLL